MRGTLLFIIILFSTVLAWYSRHHVRYMLWTGLPISRDTRIIASSYPIGFGVLERWVKFQAPQHRIESLISSKNMFEVRPSGSWKNAPDFLDFTINSKVYSSNYFHSGLNRYAPIPQDLKVYFRNSNRTRFLDGWTLYYSVSESIALWNRRTY